MIKLISKIVNVDEFMTDIENKFLIVEIYKSEDGIKLGELYTTFETNGKRIKWPSISVVLLEDVDMIKKLFSCILNVFYAVKEIELKVSSILNELPKYPLGTEVLYRENEDDILPHIYILTGINKSSYHITKVNDTNGKYPNRVSTVIPDEILFQHKGMLIKLETFSKEEEPWRGRIMKGYDAHVDLITKGNDHE